MNLQNQKALILPAVIAVALIYVIHSGGGFTPISQIGVQFGICGICVGYILAKAGV